MSARRLVADVGGTNVRFALADVQGNLDRVKVFQTADFPTFLDAFDAYRADAGGLREIDTCAIAAAGPVDGNAVKLTNNAWVVDGDTISSLMNGAPVAVLNDLEAVAAALPHLTPNDLTNIGPIAPARPERRTMIAVNVGTGFGAATVIWRDGRWYTCPSESGHMTLGSVEGISLPADTSVEDVLSGGGLARLRERLADRTGKTAQASDVFAEVGRDPVAARTVEVFTAILGGIAGNLALATCAWGGVYLCGSVATAWAAIADIERFRAEFTRKGPMHARMLDVPTAVIRRNNAALYGLAMMPISH
ncbi:MAG TPA: ROK family protein [Xanthobacteraceae bacterium]|nr:ROK family protein [Xanthobacteraceae bacterium]